MNISSLNDKGVSEVYTSVVNLLGTVTQAEIQRTLLEYIVDGLDDLDIDDAMGTEGWRHRAGIED